MLLFSLCQSWQRTTNTKQGASLFACVVFRLSDKIQISHVFAVAAVVVGTGDTGDSEAWTVEQVEEGFCVQQQQPTTTTTSDLRQCVVLHAKVPNKKRLRPAYLNGFL